MDKLVILGLALKIVCTTLASTLAWHADKQYRQGERYLAYLTGGIAIMAMARALSLIFN